MEKTARIDLRVDEQLKRELKIFCSMNGTKMTAVITDLIQKFLKEEMANGREQSKENPSK